MSDFALSGFEQYGEKRDEQKKDSRVTLIKIIVAVLCGLLLVEGILYMYLIPCMAPGRISWSGLSRCSEKELAQSLGPLVNKTWMQFSSGEAYARITSVPGVEDVQISKRFPDRISIKVTERVPVAVTFITQNGRTVPVQIDKNGVLFPAADDSVGADSSVPLVSGIPVENVPEGMRIPVKYRPLMEQIDRIKSLKQNYWAAVSEIHVVPKEYGNYELMLYPLHSRTRILTDRSLNEEALQYMMVMLDVVNSIEPNVAEIDLRYGSVSYRTK